MSVLLPLWSRSYSDENVNEEIHEIIAHLNQKAILEEMKNNSELMDLFIKELKNEGNHIGDAWVAILYKFAEEKYVETINLERELRKKANVKAPEDEKEIDLSYKLWC